MPAGERNKRITIEQATTTQSASGEPSVTGWTEFKSVWAKLEEAGGREVWKAQQSKPEINAVWLALWTKGVTPEMRIKYHSNAEGVTRYFGIDSVQSDYRTNRTVMNCIEAPNE